MTDGKAAEILNLNIRERSPRMPQDVLDALKRGVMALDYVQKVRRFPHLIDSIPLPEET